MELDGLRRIDEPLAESPFAADALRPIHELNRRLLSILIDEARKPAGTTPSVSVLGQQLGRLPDEMQSRLAGIPISLVDAGFLLEHRWASIAAGSRHEKDSPISELVLPRPRALELAPVLFSLAASTARTSRESARLIFGMSLATADAFGQFTVPTVQWLGQARAHWVRPRWHCHPDIWGRLAWTAMHTGSAGVPPLGIRAVCRLLADLVLETHMEAETRNA